MERTVRYRCGGCGFERGPVRVGRGDGDRQMAPIGCFACGDIHAVEVPTWRDEPRGDGPGRPQWKLGDPCPVCGSRGAELLSADPTTGLHDCPRCGERRLYVDDLVDP